MVAGPDYHREYQRKHAEKIAARARVRRLARYGMTESQYAEMFERQGGLCRICRRPEDGLNSTGKPRLLAIDHNHSCCPETSRSCGKCIRGLICGRCNTVLGMVGDSRSLLRKMITYLDEGEL